MTSELSVSDLLDRIEYEVSSYVMRWEPGELPPDGLDTKQTVTKSLQALLARPEVKEKAAAGLTVERIRQVVKKIFHPTKNTSHSITLYYHEYFLTWCADLRMIVGAEPADWDAWRKGLT